jgi:hypothetical protein
MSAQIETTCSVGSKFTGAEVAVLGMRESFAEAKTLKTPLKKVQF